MAESRGSAEELIDFLVRKKATDTCSRVDQFPPGARSLLFNRKYLVGQHLLREINKRDSLCLRAPHLFIPFGIVFLNPESGPENRFTRSSP